LTNASLLIILLQCIDITERQVVKSNGSIDRKAVIHKECLAEISIQISFVDITARQISEKMPPRPRAVQGDVVYIVVPQADAYFLSHPYRSARYPTYLA